MKKRQSRKPKPKAKRADKSDPAQYARFLETAKEVGADDSPNAFDKAFKKVVRSNQAGRKSG